MSSSPLRKIRLSFASHASQGKAGPVAVVPACASAIVEAAKQRDKGLAKRLKKQEESTTVVLVRTTDQMAAMVHVADCSDITWLQNGDLVHVQVDSQWKDTTATVGEEPHENAKVKAKGKRKASKGKGKCKAEDDELLDQLALPNPPPLRAQTRAQRHHTLPQSQGSHAPEGQVEETVPVGEPEAQASSAADQSTADQSAGTAMLLEVGEPHAGDAACDDNPARQDRLEAFSPSWCSPVRGPFAFPELSGNVLKELRAAIKGRKEFVEKRVDQFVAFDYRFSTKWTFPSPDATRCPQEQRVRQLLRECRGLLLNPHDGTVLCRRFHKFFNVGELPETSPAHPSGEWLLNRYDTPPRATDSPAPLPVLLLEKVDGSLVSPVPLTPVGQSSKTDERSRAEQPGSQATASSQPEEPGVIWATKKARMPIVEAFVHRNLPHANDLARYCFEELHATPLFEWIDPHRPIVVAYQKKALVLLAVRHHETGAYMQREDVVRLAAAFGVACVSELNLGSGSSSPPASSGPAAASHNAMQAKSQASSSDALSSDDERRQAAESDTLQDTIRRVKQLDPNLEGGVLWFSDGRCVKIKSEWYIAQHRPTQQQTNAQAGSQLDKPLQSLVVRLESWHAAGASCPLKLAWQAALCSDFDDVVSALESNRFVDNLRDFQASVREVIAAVHLKLTAWASACVAKGASKKYIALHLSRLLARQAPEQGGPVSQWSIRLLLFYADQVAKGLASAPVLGTQPDSPHVAHNDDDGGHAHLEALAMDISDEWLVGELRHLGEADAEILQEALQVDWRLL